MTKTLSVQEIIKDKAVVIKESDWWDDDFIPPTSYYIVTAMGDAMYFRTRSRKLAQEWSNTLYGDNFYKVRAVIKASVT